MKDLENWTLNEFLPLGGGCTSVIALSAGGCGPTEITVHKKISYSGRVATYNADVETMDNLNGKGNRVIAKYLKETEGKAIKAAVGSLQAGSCPGKAINPNEALDRAVAAAELQAQLQSGLLGRIGSQSLAGAAVTDGSDYPQDAEITEQKERVDRSRDARDAAEPK